MKLKSNIWKLLIFRTASTRLYKMILAVYFLTLPGVTIPQVGLYAAVGYLTEFLLEIPAGYLSDRLGHKKMLVLSRISALLGVICFIVGSSLTWFILGSFLTSIGFATQSGTYVAFLKETLESLNSKDKLVKTFSQIATKSYLISAGLLVVASALTLVHITLPLYLNLFIDMLAVIIAFSLKEPRVHVEQTSHIPVQKVLCELKQTPFLHWALFSSLTFAFQITLSNYIYPHLTVLGSPIVLLGLIVTLSRIVSAAVAQKLSHIEKIKDPYKLAWIDIMLMPLLYILMSLSSNYVLVMILLIFVNGYSRGRQAFISSYLVHNYLPNSKYAATSLSVMSQINMLISLVVTFSIGFIMSISYQIGIFTMGIGLFICMLLVYFNGIKKAYK